MLLPKLFDKTLRSAWWRVLRLWRPMALWTLIIWLLIGVLLIPLSSAALRHLFFRGDDVIIGNEELLAWAWSPEGIAYIIAAGILAMLGSVVRFAGLYWMVTDDMSGKTASVRRTLLDLLRDVPGLLRLCAATTAGVLLLLAPLAIGLAAIYSGWLDEHDINYYLAAEPAEWRRALAAAAVWTSLWIVGSGYVVLRSLPALPAYLDGRRPVHAALRESWRIASGETLRILRAVLVIAGAWIALRAITHATLFTIASYLATHVADAAVSITPLVAVSATYTVATVLLDAVLSFVGFSIISAALTKYYHEDSLLQASTPISSGPRRLGTLMTLRRWVHPRRALPALLAAGLASLLLGGLIVDLPTDEPFVIVTAHRAGAHLATENTLAALERSIEAGADYAEIDVQMTRDSVVVVVHDADLMRLTADRRVISQTDFAELRDVVFGHDAEGDASERGIATLEEFIARAKGRIGLNIELKYYGWDPLLAPRVLELAHNRGMTSPNEVVIMSLNLDAVRQVRRLAPDMHTGYLATVTVGNIGRLPVEFLAVPRQVATERFIRDAQRRNVAVHVWTLNRTVTVLEMIERGVDGIITDDPELVKRLIEQLATLSVPERLMLSFQPILIDD